MNATPITVSVDLLDQHEVAVFAQLLQVLVHHRETQAQLAQGPIAQGPSSAWTPPDESSPAVVITKIETSSDTPVVADISPDSVERQFRAYAAAKGAGAARKLLDKYGAPYLKDVPAAQLGAFVAELV